MKNTNKFLASAIVGISLIAPLVSFADASCGQLDLATGKVRDCGNGNPEMVVNVWGGINSSVPHVQPGMSVHDAAGIAYTCPVWFSNYCVDISNTEYYKSQARRIAAQLSGDFGWGYWLNH